MDPKFHLFDPKNLGSEKFLEYKLQDIDIEKDESDEDAYIVQLTFENIFHQEIFNEQVEQYFDNIYESILDKTGLYLESIQIIDEEIIFAWGIIKKIDDKYYTFKPDSFE
jgi:hypothetical protein